MHCWLLIGFIFQTSLDGRKNEGGLWSLGKSKDYIQGVQRRIFFALTLTPDIQERFAAEKTAMLLLVNDEQKPTNTIGRRIFYLKDVLMIRAGKIAVKFDYIKDSIGGKISREEPSQKGIQKME